MSDSPVNSVAATLEHVIAELDNLNHNTEEDFLNISAKLGGFFGAVNSITADLKSVAGLISGERGMHASAAIESALNHSREMAAQAEEGNGLLGALQQKACQLKQNLSGFAGTVSTFRALGILTRIETARIGGDGADFSYLAEEVNSLAADVKAKVETALPAAAQLIPAVETAMQEVTALEEGQSKDLPLLISGLLAGYSSFRETEKQVYESSIRLGDHSAAISDAFMNLIVSIQFHDITRQQVEHVIDALRSLLSEAGNASSTRPNIAAAVALQSMQLADAGAKFAQSAASVIQNLDDIARRVLGMSDESKSLSGLSADEGSSRLREMEASNTSILASLSICSTAQTTIGVASGKLTQIVGQMRKPVDEIQSIGSKMRRLAINARVRAAHLAGTGAVLRVLAASLQQLADECTERTASISEELGSMSETAAGIALQRGDASGSRQASLDDAIHGMQAVVEELHSSSEQSFAQIAGIIANSAALSNDVFATRENFTVDVLFADTISRVQRMLKEIEEENRTCLPPDGAEAHERVLADFAANYTMQAERDVHENINRLAGGQTETPPAAADMGDDIEFF